MDSVTEGATDRTHPGVGRPFRSEGRRALASEEPEQLSGLDKPASCKEGPVRERK